MKKTAFLLGLTGLLAAPGVFAQDQACSTEALMAANQSLYDQFEAFAANQMEQGKSAEELSASMEEITRAGNAEEVLSRHQAELEMMEPGMDHEPSQALCDDMYTMLDQMQDALDEQQ